MKKYLLTVLSFLLISSTLSFAQTLKMGTYGISPRDAVEDAADIFTTAYNGLVNVGVETQMYFKATVGDESDGGDPEVITPANLGAVVWTLKSQPVGSVAVLGATADLDAVTQALVFVPDVQGTYVIEATNGKYTVAITINAGTYLGVADGNCALCHESYVTDWEATGHYSLFEEAMEGTASDHYAAYCIGCHTTGFDPNAANNGFDDRNWVFPATLEPGTFAQLEADFPDAMKLARIQCESCHGPAYGHGGATSMDVTLDTENCAWCHDSGTHHAYPEQWDHSGQDAGGFHGGHAIGAFVGYAGNRSSCAHCHSGSAFVEWIKNDKVTLTSDQTPVGTNISCAACHDPHANDHIYQLRTLETTLGDGTVVNDAMYGTGALCMNCHKSRRNAAEYSIDINNASSHYGAHHGPEADMLLGANAPNFGFELPTSPHAQAIDNSCVGCHMYGNDHVADENGDIILVGGHSFNMNDHDGNDNVAACADCHGNFGDSFDQKKYYINGNADLDGDGVANGLQIEVQGLLAQLADLLPQNDDGEVTITGDGLTPDIMVAGYIYFWVLEDRSFGIHNPAFTISLLILGIEHAGGVTSVDMPEDYNEVPASFTLAQNYPNPFNPTTNIQFSLPEAGNVKISVYDTIGREVAVLVDKDMSAGSHEVSWNAANMSTGIYFYKMQSNDFVTVKKMILMK